MKKAYQLIKTGLILSVAALSFAACSEDYMDEINRDPSVSTDVSAKFIIPDIELRTAQNVVGGDFNTYFGSYVEYWAGSHNQLFKAEKRDAEVRVGSTFNNTWGTVYENIRNAKLVVKKTNADATAPDAMACGIGEIMLAYNAALATDIYGDTPFTQVGDPNTYPYPEAESQESIYKAVFELLDDGIKNVKAGSNTVGQYDFIYGGNSALWVKFANGLKARYTMRLLNRSGSKEADLKKVLEYVDASFASAAEQASMQYDGSNQNPVFDFEWSRDGISSCTSMFGKLMARNDPRVERVYWDPSEWYHISSAEAEDHLAPTGDPAESQYIYAYDAWFFAEVAPVHFLSYHELQFIKAEAQARLGQTEAAKETLKGAVEAAFHIGAAHPGDGVVAEGLPASVAGGSHSVMGCADAVVEVAAQDAILHHISLLPGHSLVVYIDGSAVAGDGGIVDYVDALVGHALAHLVGEDALALAVEICLECMPHGFVEEYAGCSCRHHHGHLPAFRPLCLETFVHPFGNHGCKFFQEGIGDHFGSGTETPGGIVHLGFAAAYENDSHGYSSYRTGVESKLAKGIVHHYLAYLMPQHGNYLVHAAVFGADQAFKFLKHGNECGGSAGAPVLLEAVLARQSCFWS